MNAGRAVIRLWVFGTVFWIGAWGWNALRNCIRASGGVLFCPAIGDDTLRRTDYFHLLSQIFGPPLGSLLAALCCWWLIARLQRRLGPE